MMDLRALANAPKAAIKETWIKSVGADSLPGVQFTEPAGDPGLYGPGSSIWYVHSDVATLVGGLSGLLLGALHQPTMHGTNQHSSYTDDPLARLGRTASFVNAMTWGATPVVDKTCNMVRKMHKLVVGTMPDGRPYSANASEQLVWTAMTQSHSIMRAHLRYHPKPLSGARIDEYYAQYAQFAIKLGADIPVPSSRTEVDDYFRKPIGPDPVAKASSVIIMRAALDTMPSWAQRLYGIRNASKVSVIPKRIDTIVTRNAARVVLGLLRWGIEEPLIQIEARNRSEATAEAAASA